MLNTILALAELFMTVLLAQLASLLALLRFTEKSTNRRTDSILIKYNQTAV